MAGHFIISLINWTSTIINVQKRFSGNDSLLRVWAPQTIYDSKKKKYMIYWSMKHSQEQDKFIMPMPMLLLTTLKRYLNNYSLNLISTLVLMEILFIKMGNPICSLKQMMKVQVQNRGIP